MSQPIDPPHNLLVIGYGNTLRGDDAAGQIVAEAVAALNLPEVRVITVQQLTPELAHSISRAGRVVFVDAAAGPQTTVELRPLQPAPSGRILAHATDPQALLAMAHELFGHCPKAWWLTIPTQAMDFGESLSPVTSEGVRAAVEAIRTLARDC